MNHLEDLEKKTEKKAQKRARKKKKNMKISGRSVFTLQKIMAQKKKDQDN